MPSKLPEDPSNLNILLTTTKKEMIYNIPVNTRWYPLIPVDTRNTRKYPKYPKYPKIPERKTDTRKYPIAYFDTPTRPKPDPLPGILSNTWPDLTRYWKALPAGHWLCDFWLTNIKSALQYLRPSCRFQENSLVLEWYLRPYGRSEISLCYINTLLLGQPNDHLAITLLAPSGALIAIPT